LKVKYYAETDSLFIGLKEEYCGPGHGEDLAPGITVHYSADRELVSVEIESGAGKLVDLERLQVDGLPVNIEAVS
jgi:uncharacterized protein YuzE